MTVLEGQIDKVVFQVLYVDLYEHVRRDNNKLMEVGIIQKFILELE